MNSLLQSVSSSQLTQRVGLTLAHSLWQALVIALVLAAALRWLCRTSASARHAAACVALLVALAAPVATFLQLGNSILPTLESHPNDSTPMDSWTEARLSSPPGTSPASRLAAAQNAATWQAWTVLLWFAGMTLQTLWHGAGWLELQRLKREGVARWTGNFEKLSDCLATRMRLRFRPWVMWSQKVGGPVAFGCWHTVVLMPASMATGFTAAQIEMILAHEFAHLRRHDYLINLSQTLATTLLFYHPAVWWIDRVIRREREHACDDLAVAAVGDATGYARALVALAEKQPALTPSLAPAAIRGRTAFWHRIERLLRTPASPPSLRFWPGLVVLSIAMCAWLLLLPAKISVAQASAPERDGQPIRGDIRDRNGVELATSDRRDAQIWFRPGDVAIAYAEAHGGFFPRRRREPDPGNHPPDEREVPDITAMFDEVVSPRLTQPYNAASLRRSYQGNVGLAPEVPPDQAREVLGGYGSDPWCYRRELTKKEEQQAKEIAGQVPGMSVHTGFLRSYPFGALACHVLGYVNDDEDGGRDGKPLHGSHGASGIEKAKDSQLRPSHTAGAPSYEPGSDVVLTLDARHQTVMEETLRLAGIGRGAAVLLEVNTGDILAMASVPSYDPNDFVPAISAEKFEAYRSDETRPMINRSVRAFTPGSTFLMATSLAAICNHHEGDRFYCNGAITYGNRRFQCWIGQKGGAHGELGLREAIVAGCGPYFYQMGNAVGNDAVDEITRLCNCGMPSGVLPEEASGIMPFSRWWQANRPLDPFTSATIANISIGQGVVQTTPLQLATLAATIANGGTVWSPRLIDRIVPHDRPSSAEAQPRVRLSDLRQHGLTDTGLAQLRGAMEDVVHSPEARARAAQSPLIRIAGVTGTAQNWRMDHGQAVKDNHTWFVCYAPAERPRWALAVLVQGGKAGGVSAAPIARQILEQVSAVEAGTLDVQPKAMPKTKGRFDPVEQVVLPPWQQPS